MSSSKIINSLLKERITLIRERNVMEQTRSGGIFSLCLLDGKIDRIETALREVGIDVACNPLLVSATEFHRIKCKDQCMCAEFVRQYSES